MGMTTLLTNPWCSTFLESLWELVYVVNRSKEQLDCSSSCHRRSHNQYLCQDLIYVIDALLNWILAAIYYNSQQSGTVWRCQRKWSWNFYLFDPDFDTRRYSENLHKIQSLLALIFGDCFDTPENRIFKKYTNLIVQQKIEPLDWS